MKKTISINIASTSFFIDEDAYSALKDYLKRIEAWFSNKEGGPEIISDIESRLSELFSERINPRLGVITNDLVKEIILIMGQPEDIAGEGDENSGESEQQQRKTASHYDSPRRRRLYRDPDNKVLGGVCSGISAYFNIDPVIVRVIFAVMPFLSFGAIIPVYIVLWIAMPEALTTAQKLEMLGEDITVSNIEKKIKEEYEDVKRRFKNIKETKAYRDGESYFRRMNQRDRNLLTVVGVVFLVIVFARLIGGSFQVFHLMDFPGPFFALFTPGLFIPVLMLLGIGLIFRSALKGILIAILILLLMSIILRITGWMPPFLHWSFY